MDNYTFLSIHQQSLVISLAAATAFANGKEQILTTYRTDNFNQLPLVCDYIAVPNLV